MNLNITDKKYGILSELHGRKTVKDNSLSVGERLCLFTLKNRAMVFRNGSRWTITAKGANASNRCMQIILGSVA